MNQSWSTKEPPSLRKESALVFLLQAVTDGTIQVGRLAAGDPWTTTLPVGGSVQGMFSWLPQRVGWKWSKSMHEPTLTTIPVS